MNAKFLRLLTSTVICGCAAISLSKAGYCDQRTSPHVHIRGKIIDANGQPVSDAKLKLEKSGDSATKVVAPFITGLPASGVVYQAEATESGPGGSPCTYTTAANGEYHIVIAMHEDRGYPTPDVSLIKIDRSKMAWDKGGYLVKPK